MESLSLNELKGLCQQRRLPISGTKAELIERLTARVLSGSSSASAVPATLSSSSTGPPTSSLFPSDYDLLTIPQLKDLCRERALPVGGIKDDLVARLQNADPRFMTLALLKDKCRDAALPVTGTKADLVDRVTKSMSSGTTALLQTKSVDELKDLCRERGVAVTGKKDELVDRLKQAWTAGPATGTTTATTTAAKVRTKPVVGKKNVQVVDATKKTKVKVPVTTPSFASMTMPQLKEQCREKKLLVGGTKDELVERLKKAASTSAIRPTSASKAKTAVSAASTATPAAASSSTAADSGYESMMVPQLKDLCRSRTLPVMGTKDELVKRLKEHDDVVRAMFKKRKSPSSESGLALPATTGKRKAETDEPKTKKVKTSTMRPPTAKNVAAFAVPVARKSAPTKAKKASPKANGRYLVYSTCAYPPDGFHSYAGPGEPSYHGSFATKDEANDRVNTLFYHNNPWGLGADEMDADLDISETWPNELLRLEVCPPDSEQWVVGVKDIGSTADNDGDVIMVSGSDTEDEDRYGYAY